MSSNGGPPPGIRKSTQRRVAEADRKRAVRACDGCRRQKEKCVGGVPCQRCIRLRRQCEFRGLSPRESGDAWGNSSRHVDRVNIAEILERSKHMERILRHYVRDIALDTSSLRTMAEAVSESIASDQFAGGNVIDPEDLSMDDENFTVKPLAHNTTHYSGEFSHWNFSMRIKRRIEDYLPPSNSEDIQDPPEVKEFYRAENLQSCSNDLLGSLSCLPPRHIADFLVYIFFRYAETNYFYVDRGWLAENLDIAYKTPSMLSSKDVGTVCSIFVIFAIGTQYAYLDSETASNGRSLQNSFISGNEGFSEDDVGKMFFRQASKLISDVITVASLESVQACLLIGLYTLPLDTSGIAYIYLNLAVKLGIQNGMHKKFVGEGFDPKTIETRNRTWWTAITVERRVCIFHGRPISVLSSDVDADQPVDRADMRPSDRPSNIVNMLTSIKMSRFLEELASEISILKRCQKQKQGESLERLTKTKNNLLNWWSSVPAGISCKDTNPHSGLFRSNLHLQLEYCLIRMFVGRPFLFSQPSSTSSNFSLEENSQPSSRASIRSILTEDCVQAALEVLDILRLLRDEARLARASYTEFSSCRAALLVIIAQCLHKQNGRLRGSLQDGMSMIRQMSTGGDSARSEVSLIEAFERAIARMDHFGESARRNANPTASGYDLFKDWELLWKSDPVMTQMHEPMTSAYSIPTTSNQEQITSVHPSAFVFGLDSYPYSYSQFLEEFSAIPSFEYDFERAIPGTPWQQI